MKKIKILSFMLAFVMLLGSVCVSGVSAEYSDVTDDTQIQMLTLLSRLDIINGYPDGTFGPYDPITRAQFAKIIVYAVNKQEMALSNGGASAFSDVPQNHWATPYINLVADMGIINGYPDGTFKPEEELTFAQIVTVILRVLGYNESSIGVHWPDNYIEKANNIKLTDKVNKLPNQTVNRMETAALIYEALISDIKTADGKKLMETIGYSVMEDVLLISTKAQDKTLANNEIRTSSGVMTAKYDDEFETGTLADKIIVNKDGDIVFTINSNEPLTTSKLDSMGYSIVENCVVLANSKTDKTLANDEVKTSAGTLKFRSDNIEDMVGSVADILLDKERKVVAAYPVKKDTYKIVADRLIDNRLEYVSEDRSGSYTFDSDFTVYANNTKTQFSAVKSQIKSGSELTFYGNDGEWDFAILKTYDDVVPFVAKRDMSGSDTQINGTDINTAIPLKVYRDGLTSSLDEIKRNDVVYYNDKTNVVEAFSKKITGTYDEALPTKAYVSQVVISGKTYSVNSADAIYALGENAGSFEIGSKVTLLLGKDDAVISAIDPSSASTLDYGVVVNTSTRTSTKDGETKGRLEYVAKLFMPDGEIYEYVTDKDYIDNKGDLMRITYESGYVKLSKTSVNKIHGEVNKVDYKIGSTVLTGDVKFIELVKNETGSDAVLNVIDFKNLNVKTLYDSNVITTVSDNAFGDVQLVYLSNITNSNLIYGILKSSKVSSGGMSISGTYVVDVNGKEQTYRSSVGFSAKEGRPVSLDISGGTLTSLQELSQTLSYGRTVDAVEEGRIKVDSVIYEMSENVVIYKQENGYTYTPISMDDLKSDKLNSISLYSDKLTSIGGIVRIVIASFSD